MRIARTRPWLVFRFAAALSLLSMGALSAQEPGGAAQIIERMEKDGCVALQSGVKVCRADYSVDGHAVEAITFTPAGNGPFPGVLLIPGFDRTARDYLPTGVRMARAGLAGMAVSQP